MPHVVTDKCQGCRFTDCVTVCPVACFHIGEDMVYIDPNECVDCTACVPVCPVHAIYDLYELPEDKSEWTQINADRSVQLPVVDEKQTPLPTAEQRKQELGY